MGMAIRMLLIVSLVTQLVWSMECCGVVVLRPDLVAPLPMECAALGTCSMTPAEDEPAMTGCCASESECEAEESSCESACANSCELSCEAACDSGAPCQGVMCAPLDEKKPSAMAIVLDFVPLVAHPWIAPAVMMMTAQPQTEPVAPMILKCNHTRQAWLEVWRN